MCLSPRLCLAILLVTCAASVRAQIYDAQLAWEMGFDDDEVIFGVISGLAVDSEGDVFVLDRQLTAVHRFTAKGDYVGEVGREGEGPGEYSRVGDVFISAPGELGVVQRMPGKVVSVRYDGTAGMLIPLPDEFSGAPAYFFSVRRAGAGLVILSRQLTRDGMDLTESTTLRLVDADGREVSRLATNNQDRDLSNFVVNEVGNAPPVWAAGAAGEVYVSNEFDRYSIQVVANDGTVLRTLESEYASRARNSAEIDLNVPRMEIRTREGDAYVAEGVASPTDRDIQALFARSDGSLWVLSSRGAFEPGAGVVARFDVFGPAGQPREDVVVRGEASYRDDEFRLHGDRLFVLRGQRAALRMSRGLQDERDSIPMTVACFDLVRVDG